LKREGTPMYSLLVQSGHTERSPYGEDCHPVDPPCQEAIATNSADDARRGLGPAVPDRPARGQGTAVPHDCRGGGLLAVVGLARLGAFSGRRRGGAGGPARGQRAAETRRVVSGPVVRGGLQAADGLRIPAADMDAGVARRLSGASDRTAGPRDHDEPGVGQDRGAAWTTAAGGALPLVGNCEKPASSQDSAGAGAAAEKRGGGVSGRGGRSPEPEDRTGLDEPGPAERGGDAGPEREAVSGGGDERGDGRLDRGRIRPQDQRPVRRPAEGAAGGLPAGAAGSCDPGQLPDSQQPTQPRGGGGTARADRAALSAAVLPEREPHRAAVAGPARRSHSQPRLPDDGATDAERPALCPPASRCPARSRWRKAGSWSGLTNRRARPA